jgi:hypothetical protein
MTKQQKELLIIQRVLVQITMKMSVEVERRVRRLQDLAVFGMVGDLHHHAYRFQALQLVRN